jgi:Gas vesicle synthesis protein GvpL/GvpF
MSTLTAVETGLYLYGIIDARDGLGVATRGIDGGSIETIEADGIAAVVTRVSRQKIRPQRANLAAHNNLLRSLVEHQGVIPCAFGMVASSEEQLQDVLRANHDKLLTLLARLRGKVEMSLSVYWNTSNIFEFFVGMNQELKQMRNRVFHPGRAPSLEEKLELGRTFEALLQQCRELHTQQVIDTLSPYCTDIRAVDPGGEQMIMKLVCLVPKDQEDRFELGIQEAARRFDDHYSFKYSGPWAPFDFVDVTLDLS